jgi:hypothetical protein
VGAGGRGSAGEGSGEEREGDGVVEGCGGGSRWSGVMDRALPSRQAACSEFEHDRRLGSVTMHLRGSALLLYVGPRSDSLPRLRLLGAIGGASVIFLATQVVGTLPSEFEVRVFVRGNSGQHWSICGASAARRGPQCAIMPPDVSSLGLNRRPSHIRNLPRRSFRLVITAAGFASPLALWPW